MKKAASSGCSSLMSDHDPESEALKRRPFGFDSRVSPPVARRLPGRNPPAEVLLRKSCDPSIPWYVEALRCRIVWPSGGGGSGSDNGNSMAKDPNLPLSQPESHRSDSISSHRQTVLQPANGVVPRVGAHVPVRVAFRNPTACRTLASRRPWRRSAAYPCCVPSVFCRRPIRHDGRGQRPCHPP